MFSSAKHRDVAIFDVGSASVGVALARYPALGDVSRREAAQSTCGDIIFSTRFQADIKDAVTFKVFIKEILNAFDRAASEAVKQNFKPDHVAVFLSSSFYLARTNVFKKQNDNEFVVTPRLLKKFSDKGENALLKEHPILYTDLTDDKSVTFENSIMQVKLNGYETANPYGQKARTLSLAQHVAVGSNRINRKLQEVIRQHFGRRKISFQTFVFAAFDVFRRVPPFKSSFLLLDITGEISDLAVITEGYLAESLSFPKGRNYLIRQVAGKLGTGNEEAYSTLKEYTAGNLNQNMIERLERILTELKSGWLDDFSEALKSAMESVLLPDTVYLIGDDGTAKIFADWIADPRLTEFSLANRPLSSNFVDEVEFANLCKIGTKQPVDPFFQVELLFCRKNL
ncbi:MAG: hypothetical protein WDZ85_02725 [Candidatus Paceibacterota bacterium]